jgi:methionyl-tRNA synthetase
MAWSEINTPLSSQQPIAPYTHLMSRVEPAQIDLLLAANS